MERSILEKLPKDYNKYFTKILFAYYELKLANKLNLYSYDVSEDYPPVISNEKHYKEKILILKKEIERVKILLPENTTFNNIPRLPIDIKKELDINLASDINDEEIKIVIEALFGVGMEKKSNFTVRLPKKNKIENLNKFLKRKLIVKERK